MSHNLTPEERHEEYEWFKARGICPICRKHMAAPNRVSCPECLERGKLWYAKREKKPGLSTYYTRLRRERRKAAGLCTICGKRPPEPGMVDCTWCKARIHERDRQRRMKPSGACWRRGCMEQTVNGTRYCAEHLPEMQEQAKRMRETAMERGTWKRWNMKYVYPEREQYER